MPRPHEPRLLPARKPEHLTQAPAGLGGLHTCKKAISTSAVSDVVGEITQRQTQRKGFLEKTWQQKREAEKQGRGLQVDRNSLHHLKGKEST